MSFEQLWNDYTGRGNFKTFRKTANVQFPHELPWTSMIKSQKLNAETIVQPNSHTGYFHYS